VKTDSHYTTCPAGNPRHDLPEERTEEQGFLRASVVSLGSTPIDGGATDSAAAAVWLIAARAVKGRKIEGNA
jgi:hypothetical protein